LRQSPGYSALEGALPRLNEAYGRYNRREYVSPDPLETLYGFHRTADLEVAALVVSSISYGRVASILGSARKLLTIMGGSPAEFVMTASPRALEDAVASFRHRFTSGLEMALLMRGIGRVLREYGTLEQFMAASMERAGGPVGGLSRFVAELREKSALNGKYLLPSPEDGSACKRLFLFLKWMVRRDEVDPGGWTAVHPRDLVLPMDVHMFRNCSALGLTERRQPSLKAAVEVTDLFREFVPEDPVKFDFVITRFGIRKELNPRLLVELCRAGGDPEGSPPG